VRALECCSSSGPPHTTRRTTARATAIYVRVGAIVTLLTHNRIDLAIAAIWGASAQSGLHMPIGTRYSTTSQTHPRKISTSWVLYCSYGDDRRRSPSITRSLSGAQIGTS